VQEETFELTWAGLLSYCARFVLHLRLKFNYVLAPLFFWGAFVSGVPPGPRFWLGFVAFHVFLYGGTNMFNSYYDRDEGPIGGLERPPPVDRGLLIGSLALKVIGLLLACAVGVGFVVCYLLFVAYSVCYSHPAVRIKKRPLASALTVFAGQGIVGFAAGWLASGGLLPDMLTPTGLTGGLGGAALVSGIYPLTQIYQLADDARRSDMTLARWLGTKDLFWYIMILLGVGGACAAFVFSQKGFPMESALLVAYFVGILIYLAQFSMQVPRLAPLQIYRRTMRFNYVNSTLLLVLLGLHLWGPG
jgi:UbiA prenyltransferase family